MFFKKNIKKLVEQKRFDKLTTVEILENVPRCKTYYYELVNDSSSIEYVRINPYYQESYNIGRFTREDIIDWAHGTGKIVKGSTEAEKLQYSLFVDNMLDEKCGYGGINGKKWNHLFSYDIGHSINDNSTHSDIIKNIFSYQVMRMQSAFGDEDEQAIRTDWDSISYGILYTLNAHGIGFCGATNTPEILENLSWVRDVAFDVAKYRYLINTGYNFSNI